MWVVQVILAMISLVEALLLAYLGYKVRSSYRIQWLIGYSPTVLLERLSNHDTPYSIDE